MDRRTFVRATTGSIAAAGVPVAVSAEDHESFSSKDTSIYEGFVIEVTSETYLAVVDKKTGAVKVGEVNENEEIGGDKIRSIKENTYETKLTKNTDNGSESKLTNWSSNIDQDDIDSIDCKAKQFRLSQEDKIGAAVGELTDIPEMIERTEHYIRKKDGDKYCKNDCNHHWVSGTSMEFNETVADASKTAIIAAILAVIAASGSGILASIFGNKAVEIVVGAVAGNLVGASLSIGYYDFDLNYVVGSKKMIRGGYGLGPWKPGKTGLIDIFAKPGHGARCDWH